MFTYYTPFQLITLFGTILLCGTAIVFWHGLKKYKYGFFFLIFAAILIRFSIIQYDPFINLWDEQYHALVAKNMIKEPFKPMLYKDPILPYDYSNWSGNHIWLQKPPLFMWQMALSMKIFGVNVFGVRFPGALMSVLMMLLIFAMAKRWLNKHIAFYAALLFTCSSYILNLVSSYQTSDHNDTAFLFYVTASIWAWSEFMYSRKKFFILLIGLFAGISVLIKWFPGLIVFAGWSVVILVLKEHRKRLRSYLDFFISFLIAVSIFLSWELYTYYKFPIEYADAAINRSRHFWEVVGPWGGNAFYQLNILNTLYANGVKILIFPAIILLYRRIKSQEIKIGFLTILLTCFLFYTIAATKRPSYQMLYPR